MANEQCSVDGCGSPRFKRAWCARHYKRWWRHGDPLAGRVDHGSCRLTYDRLVLMETDDCVLWPHAVNDSGYGRLFVGGRSCRVHVLACEYHHGTRPSPRHEVAHSCGVRACLNYRHLRWATPKENNDDMYAHGTRWRKLTWEQVEEIRRRHADGTGTHRGMAAEYGVSRTTISNILSGKNWKVRT